MKELTIEEKAKAYDKATKIIKANLDALNDITEMGEKVVNIQSIKNCFYGAFPELKESEDEQSKKWILEYLYDGLRKSDEQFKDQFKGAIAWLKKQKSVSEIVERYKKSWYNEGKIDGKYEGITDDVKYQQGWHDALEKQSEQNLPSVNERAWLYLVSDVLTWESGLGQYLDDPRVQKLAKDLRSEYAQKLYNFPTSSNSSNKVETKFHKGDWITNGAAMPAQISSIEDDLYFTHNDTIGGDIESIDKEYHLWTINDAEDGDVLATDKGGIFIYAKTLYSKPYAYCGVDKFGVFKDNCLNNNWANSVDNIHPATKEQRDLLFQKMHDAGYDWDTEKKELNKIAHQKSN